MTPNEINQAIAELMGWKWMRWGEHTDAMLFLVPPDFPQGSFVPATRKPDEPYRADNLPSYHSSLGACAEFEATLTDEEFSLCVTGNTFVKNLWDIMERDDPDNLYLRLISATAAQRCEAFLRVKGKWEEGK